MSEIKECPSCMGEGFHGELSRGCETCDGEGWIDVCRDHGVGYEGIHGIGCGCNE